MSLPTLHISAHSENHHTDDAAVSLELAQDEEASSATPDHLGAAQDDDANLKLSPTSPTVSFLGIPPEIRYMIYGYLWARTINLYVDPPSHSHPNAAPPIFQVNRQVRLEAIDKLRRTRSLTFNIHATVKNLDFSKIAGVLADFRNNRHSEKRGGGVKIMRILLSLRHDDPQRQPQALEEFVESSKKGGWKTYEHAFTGADGVEMDADASRRAVASRLRRSVLEFPTSGKARRAVRHMQGPK